MANESSGSDELSRRAVLAGVGATVGSIALTGRTAAADASPSSADPPRVVVRQGEQCFPVAPFTGEQSVEEYYDYRIPDRYASEANGGTDPGSGPYYSSEGTTRLQQDGTSLLFLYDGPGGLSLVAVHGSTATGPSGGGSATFEVAGLPDDGSWVVRDDYYTDPDTGAIAGTNYDNWDVDGEPQVVDWTWADGRTDGGAFRGLAGALPITVAPAFDRDATLFGEHYDGTVGSWQFLAPDGDGVTRTPLDLDAPVTIEAGTCGSRAPPSRRAAHVETIEFKGCGEAWFVFEEPFEGTLEVAVETTAGWQSVEVDGDSLRRVPGQFGDSPLVRWRVRGDEKVLAVETAAGITDNPHECARAGEDEDEPEGDDRDDGDETDDDDEREAEDETDDDEDDDGDEDDEDDDGDEDDEDDDGDEGAEDEDGADEDDGDDDDDEDDDDEADDADEDDDRRTDFDVDGENEDESSEGEGPPEHAGPPDDGGE